LRASAPARARQITEELTKRFDGVGYGKGLPKGNDRMELVIALGNSGSPEALPLLRRLSTGGELRERTQAIEALRFIDDPGVDPLLLQVLDGAKEESVRMAVISAVRFRSIGPFAGALAEVARRDPEPTVRSAVVALLGDRLRTLPTLRPVLEEVERKDSAAKNRELAGRYLAGVQGTSSAAAAERVR